MLRPPQCPEINQKSILHIILLFLIILIPFLFLSVFSFTIGKELSISQNTIKKNNMNPKIDGNIIFNEWKYANLKYNQWLYFENVENVYSSWNYLYVGQNSEYIFIALDLLSFIYTNDSEYLQIHMMTSSDISFTAESRYMYLQNWGKIECLVFNISTKLPIIDNQYNTIKKASIEIAYTSTFNDNRNHRNIELSIPKTEFENLNDVENMSIFISGYIGNTTYIFSAASIDEVQPQFFNSQYYIEVKNK